MTTETDRELLELFRAQLHFIDEHAKCAADLLTYGCAFMRNGKRIDPREITHSAREDAKS